jgi:hypothetical protein
MGREHDDLGALGVESSIVAQQSRVRPPWLNHDHDVIYLFESRSAPILLRVEREEQATYNGSVPGLS